MFYEKYKGCVEFKTELSYCRWALIVAMKHDP